MVHQSGSDESESPRGSLRNFRGGSADYDQLWQETWGDIQKYGPVHRHTLEALVRDLGRMQVRTILDVGCGSGENLAALAASNKYELMGVDVSEQALAIARQRVPSARFRQFDFGRQVELHERFDLVISIQTIEHLVDDIAALRNMAAMARSYVYISTMQGRMRRSELAIGHVRNYSRTELSRKLEAANLEPIVMRGWGFPFYSPIYRTLAEYLPGGPPSGQIGPLARLATKGLYHLYRLNSKVRGDVLTVIARPIGPT